MFKGSLGRGLKFLKSKIGDVLKTKLTKKDKKTNKQEVNYNLLIKSVLNDINTEVANKTNGVLKNQDDYITDFNANKYYNANKIYTNTQYVLLNTVLDNISADLEFYNNNDDNVFIEGSNGSYSVYTLTSVKDFEENVETEIKNILG